MNRLSSLGAAALGAAISSSSCGMMSPAKDPDSLTLQVPLEEKAPVAERNQPAKTGGPGLQSTDENLFIASTRNDLSAICSDLENDGPDNQCSGEVFQTISDDGPGSAQLRQLRNRCLVLLAECENGMNK